MSSAQTIQILITLFGIALAVTVFLFGPFGTVVNASVAFLIFIVAGAAAGFAYARLARKD